MPEASGAAGRCGAGAGPSGAQNRLQLFRVTGGLARDADALLLHRPGERDMCQGASLLSTSPSVGLNLPLLSEGERSHGCVRGQLHRAATPAAPKAFQVKAGFVCTPLHQMVIRASLCFMFALKDTCIARPIPARWG